MLRLKFYQLIRDLGHFECDRRAKKRGYVGSAGRCPGGDQHTCDFRANRTNYRYVSLLNKMNRAQRDLKRQKMGLKRWPTP